MFNFFNIYREKPQVFNIPPKEIKQEEIIEKDRFAQVKQIDLVSLQLENNKIYEEVLNYKINIQLLQNKADVTQSSKEKQDVEINIKEFTDLLKDLNSKHQSNKEKINEKLGFLKELEKEKEIIEKQINLKLDKKREPDNQLTDQDSKELKKLESDLGDIEYAIENLKKERKDHTQLQQKQLLTTAKKYVKMQRHYHFNKEDIQKIMPESKQTDVSILITQLMQKKGPKQTETVSIQKQNIAYSNLDSGELKSLQAAKEKIASLSEKIPEKELQEIESRADKLLSKKQTQPVIDVKQFAAMHGSGFLTGHPLEGGLGVNSLPYWLNLMNLWKQDKGVVKCPLSKEELNSAKLSFEQCEQIIRKDSSSMASAIQDQLNKNKECTFPCGWKGLPFGHFMLCKITQVGDQVAIELLTKGGGSQYHEIRTQGEFEDKRSYKSEPVFVTRKFLDSAAGVSFLKRMHELNHMNVMNQGYDKVEPLSEKDLYGQVLMLYRMGGSIEPTEEMKQKVKKGFGVTTQRSGNCFDTGWRSNLYEAVLNNSKNETEAKNRLKSVMFAVKFQALVDGFQLFHRDRSHLDPDFCSFLRIAAEEHLTRAAKLYPEIISKDELYLSTVISEKILIEVAKAEQAALDSLAVKMPKIGIDKDETLNHKPLKPLEKVIPYSSEDNFKLRDEIATEPSIITTPPKPGEVLAYLTNSIEILNRKPIDENPEKSLAEISLILSVLPLTSGELKDPYWDQVPEKDLKSCLDSLSQIITRSKKLASKLDYPDQLLLFEMSLKAYDIAAQIAPRISELYVKDFAIKLPLNISQMNKLRFFDNPARHKTINKILDNFHNRAKLTEKKGSLFDYEFSSEEFEKSGQWNYLYQFYTWKARRYYGNLDSLKDKYSVSSPQREFFLDDNNSYLPKEYFLLFNLAASTIPQKPSAESLSIKNTYHITNAYQGYGKGFGWVASEIDSFTSYQLSSNTLRDNKFVDYMSKTSGWQENEILSSSDLSRYLLPNTPLETVKDFMIIKSQNDLKVTATLEWASSHPDQLSNPYVQGLIEQNLFEYSLLNKSLSETPRETIQLIESFLHNSLERYDNFKKDPDTFFWLTKMRMTLAGYIQESGLEDKTKELFNVSKVFEELSKHYNNETRNAVKAHLLQYMTLCFDNIPVNMMSHKQLEQLLICRFRLNLFNVESGDKCNANIGGQSYEACLKHSAQLKEWIKKNQSQASSLGNAILNSIGTESKYQFDFSKNGKELTSKDSVYVIHLPTFTIFKNKKNVKALSDTLVQNRDYQALFNNKPFHYFEQDGYLYNQDDKKVRLVMDPKNNKNVRIEKRFNFLGKKEWLEYTPQTDSLPLPEFLKGSGFKHWQTKGAPPLLLITTSENNTPCYTYDQKNGITCLDQKSGLSNGEYILDFVSGKDNVKIIKDWKDYLSVYENPENIMVKMLKSKDQEPTVSSISFPKLGLNFTTRKINTREGKEELRLESTEYPGFYLSPNRDIPQINQFQGAFLLENIENGLKKVIIPIKDLKVQSEESPLKALSMFDHNSRSDKGVLNESLMRPQGQTFYTYDVPVDPLSKRLKAPSKSAALYLSLILRNQHDYALAIKYLKESEKMEKLTPQDLSMISILALKKPYASPASTAFDLHLFDFIEKQQKKHAVEIDKIKLEENDVRNMMEKKQMLISNYLLFTDEYKEGISSIPSDLRLSPEQMKRLKIEKMEGYKDNITDFYNDIRSSFNEYKIFEDAKNSKNLERSDPRKNSRYFALVENAKTSYFHQPEIIRLNNSDSRKYLHENFFDLFNIACSINKDKRDLLLLSLFFLSNNNPNDVEAREIIDLLKIVCQNPEKFSHLEIKSSDNKNRLESLGLILKGAHDIVQSRHKEKTERSQESVIEKKRIKGVETLKRPLILSEPSKNLNTLFLKPLGHLSEFVIRHEKQITQPEFPFANVDRRKLSPLEQQEIKNLEEGHNLLPQVKVSYELENISTLISFVKETDEKIVALREKIEKLANKLPSEEAVYTYTKQVGKQVKKLTLETGLLEAFIKQDAGKIAEINPSLTDSDLKELNDLMAELFVLGRQWKSARSALDITEKLKKENDIHEIAALKQELGAKLSSQTQYTLEKGLGPVLAVYEYITGLSLRKDQVEILQWIFDTIEQGGDIKDLLFQFQAGGGKTKVLMVLMAMGLMTKGHFPILMNLGSLYEIGKQDLDKSLFETFKQQQEVLEIDFKNPLDANKINEIVEDLRRYKSEGKCLNIKAETVHGFIILSKLAYLNGDKQQILAYENLAKFFEEAKGVCLMDEAHLVIGDSLQETNWAIGKPEKLPAGQQQLIVEISKLLADDTSELLVKTSKGEKKLSEVVRLKENLQALITDDDLYAVRIALTEKLSNSSLFQQIDEKKKSDLLEYWINAKVPKPKWLVEMHENDLTMEKAAEIVLVRRYLHEVLPQTLRMIQGIDYGDSPLTNDLTCTTRRKKEITSAKFEDIIVSAALTANNYRQEGLSSGNIKLILSSLLEKHQNEKDFLLPNQVSEAQKLADDLFGLTKHQVRVNLNKINLEDTEEIEKLTKMHSFNSTLIDHFLLFHALQQIQIFPEKMTSGPADLLDFFPTCVLFTATPGNIERYPISLQKEGAVKLDKAFEASVVSTLCNNSSNKKVYELDFDPNDLDKLFEDIWKEDQELFNQLCSLIDRGGLFRNNKNEQVVKAFIDFAKRNGIDLDGAIFRSEEKDTKNKLTFIELDSNENWNKKILEGSDLKNALKQIGKDWNKLTLFTLFDLGATTGADIAQARNGKGLLTVGEGQTKTETIQAAMRLRKLLETDGQSVNWFLLKELSSQIPIEKQGNITPKDLFLWMIKNESILTEKMVFATATQGIKKMLKDIVWKKIRSISNVDEKIHLATKLRDGLVDKVIHDAFFQDVNWELGNTRDILRDLIGHLCKNLELNEKELPEKVHKDLEKIIENASSLVPQVKKGESALTQEMHQFHETKQEAQQKQEVTQIQEVTQVQSTEKIAPYLFSSNKDNYKDNLWDEKFLDSHFSLTEALKQKVGEEKEFKFADSNLLVSTGFVRVGQTKEEIFNQYSRDELSIFGNAVNKVKEKDTLLRPIHYVLAIQDEGKTNYVLCSTKAAAYYKDQLLKGTDSYKEQFIEGNIKQKQSRKAALLSLDGRIICNGKDKSGFSEHEISNLLGSSDFRKKRVLLEFLNGKILNQKILYDALKHMKKEEVITLWKDIQTMHDLNAKVDNEAFQKFIKLF